MPGFHQIGEELQKEGHQQQADVHTVHIGIGSYYDVVVTDAVQTVFYIQRVLQQVKLFVLVHYFFGKAETVKRLTFQTKNCLCHHIARFGDGTRGRITFGNKQRGILATFVRIVEMYFAVAQFFIVQRCFFGALVGQFFDAGYILAFTFRLQDSFQQSIGCSRIFMQVVVEFFL